MNEFTLANERPNKLAPEFGNDQGRQRVLFSGLDCCPGQLDLFDTDGAEPPESSVSSDALGSG